MKNLLGMGGGNQGQMEDDEWAAQEMMAQRMRENAARDREKLDNGPDSHFGSSSRIQQQGNWGNKAVGQMGNQGQQGQMKLSNGGRMPVYAQAPPPLGKNKPSDNFIPQGLLEWCESHLGPVANKPELRGVLEYCYKTENPAEVRDCFINYLGSSNQVLRIRAYTSHTAKITHFLSSHLLRSSEI